MNKTKLLTAIAVVFVLVMGTSSADTSDAEAGSDNLGTTDSSTIEETTGATDENQIAQEELSSALDEAFTGLGEAFVGLAATLGDKITDGYVDNLTSDLTSDLAALIEKYDSDNDGGLSKEELLEISEEDMHPDYKPLTPSERRAKLDEEFKELDPDKDGKMTLEDFAFLINEATEQLNTAIQELKSNVSSKEEATDSNSSEGEGH